jgi:chaperonin GroES
MTVLPLKDKVLVAENKKENTTASGIVIEGAGGLGESKTGTVLAIGPDVKDVKVGDVIYLEWNKAQVVTIDGNQRVMIKEENIVAVVDNV